MARFNGLSEEQFEAARTKHLGRSAWPKESDNVQVLFGLSLIAAPASLIAGLVQSEIAYAAIAAVWSLASAGAYAYLVACAGYWREHRLIIWEEVRRFGSPTFGG
jgi:hypothetical protein